MFPLQCMYRSPRMLARESFLGLILDNGICVGIVKHGLSFALSYVDAHKCIKYTPPRHPELVNNVA